MRRQNQPDQPILPALEIRPARLEDAGEITHLCAQLGYLTTVEETRQRLEALLDRSEESVIVAIIHSIGEPAGGSTPDRDAGETIAAWMQIACVVHLMESPIAEVIGLVVAEEYRGQGIGKAMLDHAQRWAAEHRLETIWVRSNVIRNRAHRFYKRHGFELKKSQHVFQKKISVRMLDY